ncbi:MAG: hypothetical protein ACFFDQ_03350 [Candidatus Thorarchaeota archaeon]
MVDENKQNPSLLNVKLSKIQFPEICPVCLEEPEDLVFVTITEKHDDDYLSSSWTKQNDKVSVALDAARGATTFVIPTCMRHGSKSVRSLKTKLISALGFFFLFYPILFFLIQINIALSFSRPLIQPLLAFLSLTILLILILLYGLFPRALERAIRFQHVSHTRDSVLLSFTNSEYQRLFIDLNSMNVDIQSDTKSKT